MRVNKRPNTLRLKALQLRCADIHRRLLKRFGRPRRHGPEDPLDCVIWTILSQNTNDILSEQAYQSLRKSFPRWEMLLDAPAGEIARAIRIGGLSHQKSRAIKDFARWVFRTYGRMSLDALCDLPVDEATELLTRHRGIGLKTAYVTLLFACGREVFPVDTHIDRIVRRLGLAPARGSRDAVTRGMQPLVPTGESLALHLNLIRFGREICRARRPRCFDCPAVNLCSFEPKNLSSEKF